MTLKFFGLIFYLGLLVAALLFVKDSFEEYTQGNTFYSVSHEPLTLQDMPTLTFCYKYHQFDFWMSDQNEMNEVCH